MLSIQSDQRPAAPEGGPQNDSNSAPSAAAIHRRTRRAEWKANYGMELGKKKSSCHCGCHVDIESGELKVAFQNVGPENFVRASCCKWMICPKTLMRCKGCQDKLKDGRAVIGFYFNFSYGVTAGIDHSVRRGALYHPACFVNGLKHFKSAIKSKDLDGFEALPAAAKATAVKAMQSKHSSGGSPSGVSWIGHKISKTFPGHGRFEGTVDRYFENYDVYRVTYTDGDQEEFEEDELRDLCTSLKRDAGSSAASNTSAAKRSSVKQQARSHVKREGLKRPQSDSDLTRKGSKRARR